MKRNGFATIAIASIVILLIVAIGGFLYYKTHRIPLVEMEQSTSTPTSTNLISSTSSLVVAITNWQAYATGTSYQLTPDTYCAPQNSQFASYLNIVNTGQIFGQTIDGYVIMYSPNPDDWSESQVNQISRGSFCGEGDPGIVYAYPDKLIWVYGCGGAYDTSSALSYFSCVQVDNVVSSYFSSLISSTTDWAIYQDSQFNISVPSDWVASSSVKGASGASDDPLRTIAFFSPTYGYNVLYIFVYPHGFNQFQNYEEAPSFLASSTQSDFYFEWSNGTIDQSLLSDLQKAITTFKVK